MANGRAPIDIGFAEFATQLLAELQEAVLAAQADQDARRAELGGLSAMSIAQFARRFVGNDQVDEELARLFPLSGGKASRIRAGLLYRAASATRPESPLIETKLGLRLGARDLQTRRGRATLTDAGVRSIREGVRARLADARLKALRQTAAQGLPRVVVDSGRVNVKLTFRLVDLDKLGAAKGKDVAIPLRPLGGKDGAKLGRLRLVVRQVNDQTAPPTPTATTGIGELDLTFKTV